MSEATSARHTLAPYRDEAGYVALGLIVAGALLGGLAWTKPPETQGTPGPSGGSGTMTFDYTAQVPASPAYQSTEVKPPQPVFRKLADTVEVGYSYVGDPGSIAVSADLSTSSGWKWSLPLAPVQEMPDGELGGSVTLNLNGIERRAVAGTRAAGIDMSDVKIDVATEVTTDSGTWRPTLPLVLTTQKLTLEGDAPQLVVRQEGSAATGPTPNSLTMFGVSIGIWPARVLGILMVLFGIALGLVVRSLPTPTPQEIADTARHKHQDLIVPVADVPMPRGPVVDVEDLDALAKLAKRYALLIFHWSDEAGDLYFVQDETAMYRCLVARAPQPQISRPESA